MADGTAAAQRTAVAPEFGTLAAGDGAALRTAWWRPAAPPRATVVLLTGRAEFIEKYQETAEALLRRGLQVFCLDWRNQGLSTRPLANRQKHHLDDFALLCDDLALFIDRVVTPRAAGPLLLVAHSMGGLVATLYLARHPDRAAAAVLSAPMFAIALPAWLRLVAQGLTRAAALVGATTAYAPGQRDYDPARDGVFQPDNPITSDPARYAVFHDAFRARPELRVGGVTLGWLRAAFRAERAVRHDLPLDRVATPVLLLSAPGDAIVDGARHAELARRLGRCTLAVYPDARHEILMERDAIRDRAWRDVDAFLAPILDP